MAGRRRERKPPEAETTETTEAPEPAPAPAEPEVVVYKQQDPSRRTGVVREPAMATEAAGTLRHASYLYARRAFPTDAALAEVFPVSPSRVARWKQGHPPDAENARLLRDLGIVVALLEGWIEEEAVTDWLHGTNAHLGNRRPVDVVREGRLSEVVRAIEAEKSGAFA